jgi:acetoin utilization protein AcuB
MIVADLMTSKPVTLKPCDSLQMAHEAMEAGRFRQLPVVTENHRLVGIITDRDLRPHLGRLQRTRVEAVMSPHPFSVHPSTSVEVAAHMLAINKVGSLPVVENGNLVGIITATDLLRALEALLGAADAGSARIELDVAGSGEITAAITLIRSICPVLETGTYNPRAIESETLCLRVAANCAQHAIEALRQYGFRVVTLFPESDQLLTNEERGHR